MRNIPGVVMFHIGRSGSTVLADLIGQNPSIAWDDEPFERLARHNQRTMKQIVRWLPLRFFPIRYLGYRRFRSNSRVYGCEIKFYHISDRGIGLEDAVHLLRGCGFEYFIALQRKNYLRKVVSSAVALKRNTYHLRASEAPTRELIEINPDSVVIDGDSAGLIERFQRWDDCFATLCRVVDASAMLKLTYEDDIALNPISAYSRVCSFLNVPPVSVSVAYGRTNPYPLREIISNWGEVCNALAGTTWEWMTQEEAREVLPGSARR